MEILVIDAANTVGSVPDGWWRDRAGAAARLHTGLVRADLPFDEIVLVLEGKARAGVAEGLEAAVTTIHAAGSGDDEIVAQCRERHATGAALTVATADRGLLARLATLDVHVLGPSALRSWLE